MKIYLKEENTAKPNAFASCEYCGQAMCPGQGCTLSAFTYDGKIYERIKAGDELDFDPEMRPNEYCHDCNVAMGQYHHCGCDAERCPVCCEQLIGCDCYTLNQEDTKRQN